MKDSHDESAEAYTHPNQEEEIQQQSENYSAKFEKGYKVFQLSSQLNEANIQIQKLSIKIQKDKSKNKSTVQGILRDKEEIIHKYENLKAQFGKISTMLQAQRSARKKGSTINKKAQEQLAIIAQRLDAKSPTFEAIIEVVQKLKDNQWKNQQIILTLNQERENILTDKKQQERLIKDNKQRQLRRFKEQFEKKIIFIQGQLYQQRMIASKADEMTKKINQISEKYMKLSLKLDSKEAQLSQKLVQINRLKNDNSIKQEQLRNLRLKYDLWTISRQKSRNDKLRYDVKIEQIQFQINITQKKKELFDQRYNQQLKKTSRLETLVRQKDIMLKKIEEQYIQLEQRYQQLKNNLRVYQIYKEKYDKLQVKLKQIEERAINFANIAESYAQQIHDLQQSLSCAQSETNLLQEEIKQLKKIIQQGQTKINCTNTTINRQEQLLQQKNIENQALKVECNQLNKKIAYLQVKSQAKQKQSHKVVCGQDFINQVKNQISLHYNKLLEDEMRTKRQLQLETYQAKLKITQLKSQLSKKQQQLAEVMQDKQLICFQNQRLLQIQSENQKHQQRRIIQIRDRYRQMQRVKSQNCFKACRRLKINFCFSYLVNSQCKKKLQVRQKQIKY